MAKTMRYAKAKLIAAVSGKNEDTVWTDAATYQWRKVRRPGTRGFYFCIEDVERSYGMAFEAERLSAANEIHSFPALIVIEEHAHAE